MNEKRLLDRKEEMVIINMLWKARILIQNLIVNTQHLAEACLPVFLSLSAGFLLLRSTNEN